jgi:hypothetical protein
MVLGFMGDARVNDDDALRGLTVPRARLGLDSNHSYVTRRRRAAAADGPAPCLLPHGMGTADRWQSEAR